MPGWRQIIVLVATSGTRSAATGGRSRRKAPMKKPLDLSIQGLCFLLSGSTTWTRIYK